MKLKELNYALSSFDFDFNRPKAHLEQYPTPVSLAASALYEIEEKFEAISGKIVADFGCGTGVFSMGALMLEADQVFAFDIDEDALEQAKENDEENLIEFLQLNVFQMDFGLKFDTILMNPPFGTNDKNYGNDMAFVNKALSMLNDDGAVYSLHKTACREFIKKDCAANNIEASVLAEMAFPIKKMYKFHRKNCVDVAVDFIRFVKY